MTLMVRTTAMDFAKRSTHPMLRSTLRCLTGKSSAPLTALVVQPSVQKYSDFPNTQITLSIQPSCPTEGRFAIVTDAGQDAVDVEAPITNGA
jgi:muramidase (phage lysozyme)